MHLLGKLFVAILLLIGLMLGSLNSELTIFNYYIGSTSLPLSLLLFLSVTLGCVIGASLGFVRYVKLKYTYARLKQDYNQVEAKLKK